MPRQTVALAIALLAAGATAGSGYAYQAAQTRESLAELRTQFQNDNRDLKREVCLLRSQIQAQGFTVVCRGDFNFTAFPSRAGIDPTPERQAVMSENVLAYLTLGVIVASLIGVGILVRSFGQYMTVDREKIRASRSLEKAIREYLDELQAYRKRRSGTRHSPITGFPRLDDPDHLREDGTL